MIERTFDTQFIRSIITHPEVWPYAVDDGAGAPETWQPPMGPNLCWLRIPGLDAVALAYQVSGVLWAYDAAVLPGARGAQKDYGERRSYIEMLKAWLAANTNCKHLIGLIAVDNKRSIRAAKADGLRLEGILSKAKLRGGVLVDAAIYGIEV